MPISKKKISKKGKKKWQRGIGTEEIQKDIESSSQNIVMKKRVNDLISEKKKESGGLFK